MEKRLILAIALSVAVLFAWSYVFPPPKRPAPATLPEPIASPPAQPTPDIERLAEPVKALAAVQGLAEEEVLVSNGVFEVRLTSLGARVVSWRLLHYTTPDGAPLEVWPRYQERDHLPLEFDLDDPDLARRLNATLFRVEREPIGAHDGQPAAERVRFVWSDGSDLSATKTITFHADSYVVDLAAEVVERGRPRALRLVLGPGFSAQENREGRSNYYYASQAVWSSSGLVSRRAVSKLDEPGGIEGRLNWVGLEDQFFAALMLPGSPRTEARWSSVQRTPVEVAGATAAEPAKPVDEPLLSVAVEGGQARMFVGPKRYTLLRDLGFGLERVVWFSSYEWLAWVVKYLYLGLVWLNDHVARNYGLAIVLATVALRFALFPINQYAMVTMKKSQLQMQRLQPKIKTIRAKYKKVKDVQTRAKMNQEMMDLYKAEGVNPAGGITGCLPLVAQFPILIGFYNMLTVAVELRGAPFFGWIADLSVKDPYWITPLLMGVTMFAQQKMAMPVVKDPQQLQQQRIMLFMPFMFTFICLQMPAGLTLYWCVNNVLGIGQQWLVNRHTDRLTA